MDKSIRFELNRKGVGEMLKGSDMQQMLLGEAEKIAGRAGSGYETDTFVGKTRANASIWAATDEAKSDNFENNTLLKSVR